MPHMNYRMISYILGCILLFEAAFMTVPIITALVYSETAVVSFAITLVICAAVGGLLMLTKPRNFKIYSREGYVIVSLSWIVLSVFGAIPFMLSGAIPSFIDALFETVSGFTTTGATILTEVESLPKSVLMWRSFTHWIGGMGVLVFMMAFLPLCGGQNMHIMKAESTGPSVGKLVPRVKTTAMLLYSIYFVLTLLQFIALLIAGMDVFEALNTSFATAGTGGFGVKNDSLAGYSPAVQIIVTVFMLLFSVNFTCYFLIISGKLREAFNLELRIFLVIVFAAVAIITLNISYQYNNIGDAVRDSAFTVASIISTTGFSTADFDLWPELSRTILVLLMFIGACAGSTGGGIKVTRIIILFKSMGKELQSLAHPKQIKKIKVDGHPIEHDVVRSVNVHMVCFMLVFVISLVAISFENNDLITNFTAVAASMNNIGPGLDMVGPTQNFEFFTPFSKSVLIFDMLAGRLELFPMLMLFSPHTWKK